MRDMNIRVKPFELLDVLTFEGLKQENEHAVVRFSGHIPPELEDSYVEMALNELWAQAVAIDDSGEEKILLNGIVSSLSVTAQNDVRLLTAELRSGSYLMDTMPHIRSYQDPGIQYKEVLSSFTTPYPDGNFIMTKGKGEAIPPLVLQYQETDWEFVRRLASDFHTVVIPDCKTQGVRYFFGLPDLPEAAQIDTPFYSMQKRVDEYIRKKNQQVPGIRESDAVYFIVKTREIYDLGSRVSLNGRRLYVSAVETRLEGSELYHTYYLKSENGAQLPKAYNFRSVGASLSASVVAVEKDRVQIAIDRDENQENAGANWYPYSTVYSTPDGTGWYCMPEPGDAVRFYLPGCDESEAYVISSTHLQSSASDERVNPDCKSIMNTHGKEILFTPDSLTLTNNAGMSIELLDNEGIRILSNKAIHIKSDELIDISSVNSTLKVIAPKSIQLLQGETQTFLEDKVVFKGAQIRMD